MSKSGVVRLAAGVAAAALAGVAGHAQAGTVTVYNTLASWTAAATGTVVVEDFADAALQAGFSTAQGGSVGGGVFNGLALTQFNDAANPLWNFGATAAFGADFDFGPGGAGDGLLLAIDFVDGSSIAQAFIGNPAGGTFAGFFGLVASTAIKSVRFDSPFTGQEEFNADNLRFTTAGGGGGGGGTVPEPGSLALCGLALMAAFAARRQAPV
jgi:PEP-CTERM motif